MRKRTLVVFYHRSEEGIVLVTREMLRKLQVKQERCGFYVICSEMFPPAELGAGGCDRRVACGTNCVVLMFAFCFGVLRYPSGIPDAHVVSRRDTFADISLLFGHYLTAWAFI